LRKGRNVPILADCSFRLAALISTCNILAMAALSSAEAPVNCNQATGSLVQRLETRVYWLSFCFNGTG
jgi:hypothetical protein